MNKVLSIPDSNYRVKFELSSDKPEVKQSNSSLLIIGNSTWNIQVLDHANKVVNLDARGLEIMGLAQDVATKHLVASQFEAEKSNIDRLHMKVDQFYENSKPARAHNFGFFSQFSETTRIGLGNARVAYKELSGKNSSCSLTALKLGSLEKEYFIPVKVKSADGSYRNILINKNSFLKNYSMDLINYNKTEDLFSMEWNKENAEEINSIFLKTILGPNYYEEESLLDDADLNDEEVQAREELEKVGATKQPGSANNSDTDLIVRTVMRHPSVEARQLLNQLHQAIKAKFQNASDEGLLWLLGGGFS